MDANMERMFLGFQKISSGSHLLQSFPIADLADLIRNNITPAIISTPISLPKIIHAMCNK